MSRVKEMKNKILVYLDVRSSGRLLHFIKVKKWEIFIMEIVTL